MRVVKYGANLWNFQPKPEKIKEILSTKSSYIFRKWNILALILKSFLCFLKISHFLIFQETKAPKKFLIFFQKKPVFYFSGNENPNKIIYISVGSSKAHKNQTFFYFFLKKL